MIRSKAIAIIATLAIVGAVPAAGAPAISAEEEAQLAALLALVQRGAERGAKENVDGTETRSLDDFSRDEQRRLTSRAQQNGGRYIGEVTRPQNRPWTPWSATYETTRPTNPLISKACQDRAFESAAANHAGHTGESPAPHFLEVMEAFKADRLSARAYFDHLTDCAHFCAQIVARLLSCHLDAIAALPVDDTVLVLFEVGRRTVTPRAVRRLSRFAQRINAHRHKVLLFGSASRLSPRDPADVNATLSRDRALAVRRALVSAGVDDERIYATWIGQDPPRLSAKTVAEHLGFASDWRRLNTIGRPRFMDQNVLVVAWKGVDGSPLRSE